MHHFVTEMCTRVHISVTKWCIVGYLPDAWWDLWDGSFGGHAHTALAALKPQSLDCVTVYQQVQITKAQAGGKSGCATVDHLIVLKQTIQEKQEKGHTAYIIFLDVRKAYDKAWLDAIIYTLHKNGVHDKNLRMIKKINSNLTARIQTR